MSINNILAKKIGSTTIFKDGESKHATILKSGPCTITQIKTQKNDGYNAVQLGFEHAKNLNKPLTGHLLKTKNKFKTLREFKISEDIANKVGDSIDVSIFSKGQYLNVTSKSKGRGFTGVVKRWHFKGGPKTHGQSDRHRAPGSIGAGSTPGKAFKGKKMPGRYGGEQFTIKNLEILDIDLDNNLLYISGSVPGAKNTLVSISASNKAFTPYEEAIAEEAKVDEPKTDEPKVEEAKVDEAKTEEAKVEEPKAEKPNKAEDKNKGSN